MTEIKKEREKPQANLPTDHVSSRWMDQYMTFTSSVCGLPFLLYLYYQGRDKGKKEGEAHIRRSRAGGERHVLVKTQSKGPVSGGWCKDPCNSRFSPFIYGNYFSSVSLLFVPSSSFSLSLYPSFPFIFF
jgi:hypothetical protein